MKPSALFTCLALGLGLTLMHTAAVAAETPDLASKLPLIAQYRFGQNRQPLAEVEALIRNTSDPAQHHAIERQLASLLEGDATWEAKQWVCRQLWFIGTAESVPALSKLLSDEKLADMACYAIGRNASPEAGKALCDALRSAKGSALTAVLNALGDRRETGCLTAVVQLTGSKDPAVAEAAMRTLGKIGGKGPVGVLRDWRNQATGHLRAVVAEAYLQSAEPFLGSRMWSDAAAIYRDLLDGDETKAIQRGALLGLVRADESDAIRRSVALLQNPDAWSRGSAIACLRLTRSPDATRQFAAVLPTLTSDAQILLIEALGDRADLAARPAIVKATESDLETVRAAAYLALGKLGDVSSVNLLAAAIAKAPSKEEKDAALASLRLLPGNAINAAIAALIRTTPPMAKADLISVLADRNAVAETPFLSQLAAGGDAATRRAAFKALGHLGGAPDLAGLTRLLVEVNDDAVRDAAEQAVIEAAQQIPESNERAGAILAALSRAKAAPARCSLLRVLASVPTSRALDAMVAAAKDANAEVQDTAIRELANWPSPAAFEPLERIAQSTENRTHRVLALRGYLRMLSASDRPTAEKVARYREALNQAQSTSEKKLVLAGLAGVPDIAALQTALSFLTNPDTQAEAIQAATQIGGHVYVMYPGATKAAMEQIIAAAKGAGQRQQAQAVLKQIDGLQDYLTAWQMAGPFEQAGKNYAALFNVAFAPEKPGTKDVAWKALPASANPQRPPWIMDLLKALGGEQRVAYVRTWIRSDTAQPARLELGSDDGVKVWLNGKQVFALNVARPITPGSDKVNVNLKAGWNELLMKVTQNNQGWEFSARLTKPDGSLLNGLRVSGEPPQ